MKIIGTIIGWIIFIFICLFFIGICVSIYKRMVFKNCQNLAERGDANAQNQLGNMYLKGENCTKNETEAAKWYEKSAEQGNVNAQLNLGWMYENGVGVGQNLSEAFRWYEQSANQGNVEAQLRVGTMYFDGEGVRL